MAKYTVDLSAWIVVDAESHFEAFAYGQQVLADLGLSVEKHGRGNWEWDGEVVDAEEKEDGDDD